MEADFSWVYLIFFLMIPLARILPRVLRKFRSGDFESQGVRDGQFESNFDRFSQQSDTRFESNTNEYQEPPKSSKPQTKNMLVLGELHRGVRLFENIQKIPELILRDLIQILKNLKIIG